MNIYAVIFLVVVGLCVGANRGYQVGESDGAAKGIKVIIDICAEIDYKSKTCADIDSALNTKSGDSL